MDIARTAMIVKKAAVDNSPLILTGVAVTGVVTTSVLAVKATFKAADTLQVEYAVLLAEVGSVDRMAPLTNRYKVELVWKHYIPAALTGVVTIACIVGANTINTKRNAALVSLYSITETALKEYKDKVVETIGDAKEKQIGDAVAADRIDRNPVGVNEVFITGSGDQLCYDDLSGRYFRSDIEAIRKAQNDINVMVINEMCASQNEFYNMIGLSDSAFGEEVGWTTDNLLDIHFTSHIAEGKPCLALNYTTSPVRNFHKFG